MNNINWKVRLHSYTFWMAVISAIIIAIFYIFELCNVQLPVSMEETINAAKLILAIPVAIGIIADPTTKGIGDSAQALTYDAPKEDTEKGGLMTYNEFVKAYNGKATDYDGAYGAQCVDLIKLYLNKVFGIKPGSWGNAKYYWLNFSKHSELTKNFTKIKNTPSFVPQKGDIMVWDGDVGGGCGHVAICTGEGNTSEFYSYDQNWNGKAMHKVKHGYDNVYGVLRPKDQSKVTGAPTYKVGSTYTLQTNVKVRTGAGTNYAQKSVSQLTADGKKNATAKSGGAVLKKGTKVTVKAVKTVSGDIWLQIPSGWVAAYYDGDTYIK